MTFHVVLSDARGSGRGDRARVTVRAVIEDARTLAQFAREQQPDVDSADDGACFAAGLSDHAAPGVTLGPVSSRAWRGTPRFGRSGADDYDYAELSFDVEVTDRAALLAWTLERYQQCWRQESHRWLPADERQLLYEALVASNTRPSPADYGIALDSGYEDIVIL